MFKFLLVVFALLISPLLVFSQKSPQILLALNNANNSEVIAGQSATKPTNVLWRSEQLCKNADNTRYYPPTIDGNTVYITCLSSNSWQAGASLFPSINSEVDAYISAINKDTGQILWKHKPESQFATYPLIHDGMVFYTTNGGDWNKEQEINKGGGAVHALDAKTGELKWSYRVKSSKLSYLYQALNEVIYFSDLNGNLYAVEAQTGQEKWVYKSGHKVSYYLPTAFGEISLSDGTLYFSGEGDYAYALEEKTGALKWATKTKGGYPGVLLAENGKVYLAVKKKFYMIDARGGEPVQLSEQQAADLLSRLNQKVVYRSGRYKDFLAKDRITDEEIWRFKTSRACEGGTLSNGAVFFPCFDGKLYAVDAQTGDLKWSLSTKGPRPTVAVKDGIIYCTIGDGRLYAIK